MSILKFRWAVLESAGCEMKETLRLRLANWRANERRWEPSYILSRLPAVLWSLLGRNGPGAAYHEPLIPPVETEYVNILHDSAFLRSVLQVKEYTCLDAVRLANLWNFVRLVDTGLFLEVGSFRGGTALHICNAIDEFHKGARFYCFDPFEEGGFEKIGDCDAAFKATDFTDTSFKAVDRLLSKKPFAKAVQGFFPAAAEGLDLRGISFCHLDVDVYEATRNCLEYLAPRMSPRSLIVLDDVGHFETPGVDRAMKEFVVAHPSFLAIPIFPCHALLLPKTFWQA